jgi:hypothetical protein
VKKTLFASLILLVAVSASFAATPTDASLKGKYSFQLSSAKGDWWSTTINCKNPDGSTNTLIFGGSAVSNSSVLGVMTFDGKGNITGTFTQYGNFDQTLTNATIVPSCTPGAGNSGYAVYDAPTTGTFTGTYSIQSTGLGTMALSISEGDTPNFIIELGGAAAVRNTVFMTELDPTSNRVEISGSAVLQ